MRFDVHRVAGSDVALALKVQSEFHDHLDTCVVVPLIPVGRTKVKPARRLQPVFTVAGQPYVLATPAMASVPVSDLGDRVGSLADQHSVIVDALDFLLQGF
ncbi:CcdB family protein [Inquilinus sp. YAF38]|uniref:CcdB family protein n=1 Tax=Inquilinus sp. YAF38 TaxID=3233084 RepID=UPI003F8FC246